MKLRLHLQPATKEKYLPTRAQFRRWFLSGLAEVKPLADSFELTIRLVDEAESAELNSTYRHKSGPTNVLSFSFGHSLTESPVYLGDLIICAPLVAKEAEQQQKNLTAHFAHLTVHGVLHLLGYDHETESQAEVMESLEISILNQLGIADPYAD
jgi:probable rRNA maturation factor